MEGDTKNPWDAAVNCFQGPLSRRHYNYRRLNSPLPYSYCLREFNSVPSNIYESFIYANSHRLWTERIILGLLTCSFGSRTLKNESLSRDALPLLVLTLLSCGRNTDLINQVPRIRTRSLCTEACIGCLILTMVLHQAQ